MEQKIVFYSILYFLILTGGLGLTFLFAVISEKMSRICCKVCVSLGCVLIAVSGFLVNNFLASSMIDWFDVVFLLISAYYLARCFLAKSWLDNIRHFLTVLVAFAFMIFSSEAFFSSLVVLLSTDLYVELFVRDSQKKKGNSLLAILAVLVYLFYSEYLTKKLKS